MWIITMRSPLGEPREFQLKPGKTTIGRKTDHDIYVPDSSASRFHAEVQVDPANNLVMVRDLGSMNGTYVNRERLTQPRQLKPNDEIRIGEHVLSLAYRDLNAKQTAQDTLSGTQPLTRDLVLESIDHHAILLYKVARQLNTVIDLDTALREVSALMQTAMGADRCEMILADKFSDLGKLGFPTSIARLAIEQRSAVIIPDLSTQEGVSKSGVLMRIRSAMCVPVLIEEDIIGLIYVYKTDTAARPFDQRDLQLAVAISHQAAMTVQRMRLLEQVTKEQHMRSLLQRFVSPAEADALLKDYQQTGRLPGVRTQPLTALFIDVSSATRLSERLGTRRFGEFITRYYQDMTDAVFEEGGLLQQYMGDGMLAVFSGAARPEPEARAARVAQKMLSKLGYISAALNEVVEVGIGIHTGPMIAGYVEVKGRVEFSVVGDAMSITDALQQQARPNRIFITTETQNALSHHFHTQAVAPITVKGQTLDVYEIVRE